LSQDGHSTVTWYQLTHYTQCSQWKGFQVSICSVFILLLLLLLLLLLSSLSVQCIMHMASLPITVYITLCTVLYTPCGYMSLLFSYQRMCDMPNSQCPVLRALQSCNDDWPTALDVDASLIILASHAGSLFACGGNQSCWSCSCCTSPCHHICLICKQSSSNCCKANVTCKCRLPHTQQAQRHIPSTIPVTTSHMARQRRRLCPCLFWWPLRCSTP